jgi:hypothetical protein
MTFRSTAVFSCDGCKVIETDEIEVPTDIMQARPPVGWLRAETHKLTGNEGLEEMVIKFFCPHCTPLIESYLAGRPVAPNDDVDASFVQRSFDKRLRSLHRKAVAAIGIDAVSEMFKSFAKKD